MASFCPHCGAEAPEEARFCMRCGRERSPATPPPPPAAPPGAPPGAPPVPVAAPTSGAPTPPPPAYAPGPAQPSAFGQFLGRALRGDWAGAAQAALWPVGLLLIAAFALAIPSYGQDSDHVVVGFADRMRIALAALLQGLGGSLEVSGGSSGGSLYDSGYDSGSSGSASGSVIPLLVTVVWIVALVIGVRMLRTRLYARIVPGAPDGASAGLEAAVRVALLVTGATLVLALIGQPDIQGVSLSTAPFLTALWTLLLALGVAGGVLHGDDLKYRVAAARPGVRMAVRAFGTAVRAMGWVLLIALVLGWIGLAIFGEDGGSNPSDLADSSDDGSTAAALGAVLMMLPNLALGVLGLCWGAPLEVEGRGSSSFGSGGYEKESFGLSRLGDQLGSGALAYALAVGLICALVMGVLTARRSLDRREQLLSAGLFFGLFLLLAGVGGLAAEFTGDLDYLGSGAGRIELGLSVPDALLFGLLWVGGAAFLAPYLMQMAGVGTGIVPAPVPAMPGRTPVEGQATMPGQAPPPLPGQAPAAYGYPPEQATDPYDPGAVHLAPPPAGGPRPKRNVGIWVGTIVGTFVIGGGAAAGVLLLQDDGGDDGNGGAGKKDAKGNGPVATRTQDSGDPAASPTPTPAPTSTASTDVAAPTGVAEIPAGYHQVVDEKGFSFVIPDVWDRLGVERDSQITYAGSTGMEKYVVGVIPNADYTSYGNLLAMEKHLKEDKNKTNYRRILLDTNTFQGVDGARWEYTYENEAGQTVHGVDQSYIVADGTEYTIFLTGKDDMWSDLAGTYQIGLDSWRLTDTE
ncbi:zinc-ribbon domain-containing protein [Streptomyces sp. NPDC102467]|uniref:zinc-ribbon domain-containing protein n=1 Tax=Streptomyces sp. NPDC102467 TaxID=3366179 RepID=UPI00382D3880